MLSLRTISSFEFEIGRGELLLLTGPATLSLRGNALGRPTVAPRSRRTLYIRRGVIAQQAVGTIVAAWSDALVPRTSPHRASAATYLLRVRPSREPVDEREHDRAPERHGWATWARQLRASGNSLVLWDLPHHAAMITDGCINRSAPRKREPAACE